MSSECTSCAAQRYTLLAKRVGTLGRRWSYSIPFLLLLAGKTSWIIFGANT